MLRAQNGKHAGTQKPQPGSLALFCLSNPSLWQLTKGGGAGGAAGKAFKITSSRTSPKTATTQNSLK